MTTDQSLRADWIAIGVGAIALALILGALGYQYLGGLPPCQMCHWQRWPHIAAAMIGLIGGGFLPRRYALVCRRGRHCAGGGVRPDRRLSGRHGMETTCRSHHLQRRTFMCWAAPRFPSPAATWLIPVFLGQSLAFFNAVISLGVAAIAGILLEKTIRAA